LSYYGLSSSDSSCSGITNETTCINKKKDWSGYGYYANVCDWK